MTGVALRGGGVDGAEDGGLDESSKFCDSCDSSRMGGPSGVLCIRFGDCVMFSVRGGAVTDRAFSSTSGLDNDDRRYPLGVIFGS